MFILSVVFTDSNVFTEREVEWEEEREEKRVYRKKN